MKAEEPPEEVPGSGTGPRFGSAPEQTDATTEPTTARRLKVQPDPQAQELGPARLRAEQKGRYQANFLASMSHKLRTPLNSIIGFSELLEQELFGPLNPRQKLYVSNVLESGHQLLGLISDVLDLSKIDAGRLEIRRGWVAVSSLVEAEERAVQPLAQRRQIKLVSSVAAGLPELYVDSARIRQALHHLLTNALWFTAAGGAVSIRALAVDGQVRIEVTDSGIGIPKEVQPLLFRELIVPTGEGQHGAGLGLVLTRRLVELHGGQVDFHSEPAVGSTFALSLPLLGHQGKGRARVKTPGYRDLNWVLVADSEPADQRALEAQLNRVGLSATLVKSAADAVRAAGELRPGAILIELALPDADGWSVVSRLRGDPVTAALPILIVSAQDRPERSDQLGVSGYIEKPVVPELILRLLLGLGLRLCPIAGVRVLIVSATGPYELQLLAHLHAAGCQLQRLDSLDEPARIVYPVEVAIIDITSESRVLSGATPAQVRERLGAVPILWLVDQDGEPLPELTRPGDAVLALADALHLPHLVRSIYGAVRTPSTNADSQSRSAGP